MKILRVVGCGFFTLVGHKVFHVKILVFIISAILPTLESRTASNISLTVCLRTLGKNTIHPPLVSCTLKPTHPPPQHPSHLTAYNQGGRVIPTPYIQTLSHLLRMPCDHLVFSLEQPTSQHLHLHLNHL